MEAGASQNMIITEVLPAIKFSLRSAIAAGDVADRIGETTQGVADATENSVGHF